MASPKIRQENRYAELDKRNQRFIDSIVNAIASNPHEEVRCVIGREVHTNYCCHCDKPVVRYLGKENS